MLNMAIQQSNGKPAKPAKSDYAPYVNQHNIIERARRAKKRNQRSWMGSILSTITRLLTWYSIITISFRCPANLQLLTDSSPKICKPYFHTRDAIVPHLEPYYDAYASEYVEALQPYYKSIKKNLLTPIAHFGLKHGAPRLAQVQDFVVTHWTQTVEPHLVKYGNEAKQQYDHTIAPYVAQATEVVSPFYGAIKTASIQSYHENILPAYDSVKPHALYAYGLGSEFLVNTGVPYSKWAWASGAVFVERKVWPRVRILYGENVEPQLIRIGERLGRYRDGKKLKAAIDEIDVPSSESLSIQTIVPTTSESFKPAYSTATPSSSSEPPSQDTASISELSHERQDSRDEIVKNAKLVVAEDLKTWQERFAKAADEGADELEERVTEITDRLIQSQAKGVGEALIIELEETVKSQVKGLQKKINSIVGRAPENPEEELKKAIRKAGTAIKEKAQAIRDWRQGYDQEVNYLVSTSSKETFDIIDNISQLGLAEIGRKWAWTDGVTHKDWKKYHAMKDKFGEWREEVEKVVTKHSGLLAAHAAAEDVESRAMAIGAEASKELLRLKDIGKWKIATGDSTDDFSTKIMPAVVEKAAQKVMEKISDIPGDIKEDISGTSTGTVESLNSQANEAAASVVADIQGMASAAQDSVSDLVNQASSLVVGPQEGSVESQSSTAQESAGSLDTAVSLGVSAASDSIPDFNDASSPVTSTVNEISSPATAKVWGGAEAQFVQAREIIYDDIVVDDTEDSYSLEIQSMASGAGDKFGDITKAVSEAFLGTKTTQGSVESVTSLAAHQYSSALRAASEALYGTPQRTGESIASVASSRYSEAVLAASAAIHGTPVPYIQSVVAEASRYVWPTQGALESISSVASSKLSEGLASASAQYASLKAAVGATPMPASGRILAQAQQQYYMGIGLAHERYSEFVAAASSAVLPSALPFHQSVSSKVAEQADSFASAASTNWERLLAAASVQVYGQPTPIYESVYSQARDYASQATEGVGARYESVQAIISELVVGKEPDFTASVYSRLSSAYYTGAPEAYASASSYASENAASASSYASDTFGAASSVIVSAFTPPAVLEDIMNNASSQLDAAVEAASAQIYGTTTGYAEAASSSASSVLSAASEAIYGPKNGYAEAASSSISNAAENAAAAISIAIYGFQTGAVESATSVAGDTVASVTEAVAENFAAATDAVGDMYSRLFVEEEKGAVESAQIRLGAAVESARSRLAELAGQATSSAGSIVGGMGGMAESMAAKLTSTRTTTSTVTVGSKDEL